MDRRPSAVMVAVEAEACTAPMPCGMRACDADAPAARTIAFHVGASAGDAREVGLTNIEPPRRRRSAETPAARTQPCAIAFQ